MMMRHTGSIWVEREGEEAAVAAELEFSGTSLRLWIGGGVAAEWSSQDVRMTDEGGGRFSIAVEGDRLIFEAPEADGLRSDAAALLFRSRIGRGTTAEVQSQPRESGPQASPISQPVFVPATVVAQKSAGAAAVLSFFIPGVGQMYNGEVGKGIVIVLGQLFNFFVLSWFFGIGLIVGFVVWLWAIFDAYNVADSSNASAVATASIHQQRAFSQLSGREESPVGAAVSIPLSLKSASPIQRFLHEELAGVSTGSVLVKCNGRPSEYWFPRTVVEVLAQRGISRVEFEGLMIGESTWQDFVAFASRHGVMVERVW